jgi:hypothetical protein
LRPQLEIILKTVRDNWGPMEYRAVPHAVKMVGDIIQESVPHKRLQNAIARLFVHTLRQRGFGSGDHIGVGDILGIFRQHIELGTTLYIIRGYFAHHAPDEFCDGTSEDYHEHQIAGDQAQMFDEFDDVKDFAAELMSDTVIPNAPDFATGCRVTVDMVDADGNIPLGEWEWDKKTSYQSFVRPQRN